MTLNQKIPKHDNSMNIENAQVQMRKGILEFCIMHIISRGEVYASDMLDELTSAKIMVVLRAKFTRFLLASKIRGCSITNGSNHNRATAQILRFD